MNVSLLFAIANDENVAFYVRVVAANLSRTYTGETDPARVARIIRDTKVFIVRCDDRPVGIVSYEDGPEYYAHITEVVILPEFQRRGIGKAAFDLLMQGLRNTGRKKFRLETHPEGPALLMYADRGFQMVETIENYMGTGEPRIVMDLIDADTPAGMRLSPK